MSRTVILALLIVLFVLLCWLIVVRRRREALPSPPGPKPLLIVGNVREIRSFVQDKQRPEWRRYGDVMYMHALGRELVVLNSASAATDLLEKRGSAYSNRPALVMARELIGRRKFMLVADYNDFYRASKRMLWNALTPRAVAGYQALQEAVSLAFLEDLLRAPEQFRAHIHRNIASLAFRVAYGCQSPEREGYYIQVARRFSQVTSVAVEPGRWLVDSIPILQHIPAWFPGAHFKRWALTARVVVEEIANAPYAMVKGNMAKGQQDMTSFASRAMEAVVESTGAPPTPEDDDLIKHAAASMFSGSTGTTSAFLTSFFHAMARNPDVQKRAQDELDRVVGPARLPALSDRESLPYIERLIQELHRVYPAAPFTPHGAAQDDEYRGFRIRKGTSVAANLWAIFSDPVAYPRPEEFDPDRFMPTEKGAAQPDPRDLSFGLGRRRCPGTHLANATTFLFIARTLATFDVRRPVGPDGAEYAPALAFTDGLVCEPQPFACRVVPRSAARTALIGGGVEAQADR
ncbi:cytochrome P450 [Daedalea quercina L-15889]|uniref:Cytochrome P450 n=1 Tax=Daedalea quercina L-15889 TaxID=1314783 RepID=A0A165N2Z2_9APHY|nr:cytochrome P450 [Daedalea quercina L-15889]